MGTGGLFVSNRPPVFLCLSFRLFRLELFFFNEDAEVRFRTKV